MMKKRTILFGDYDTAQHGWTLTSYKLSDPELKTNYVDKTGGDGSWDLSTVLSGGIPRYKNRTLNVTLECSEGDRDHREKLINDMVNNLDGLEWHTVLPDRPDHYLVGRLRIAVNHNSPAYASVTITGTCAPWLYHSRERIIDVECTSAWQTHLLINDGRRSVIPELITSKGSSVKLRYGDISTTLSGGTYEWAGLLLTPGRHSIEYSGSGTLQIRYREAVLR